MSCIDTYTHSIYYCLTININYITIYRFFHTMVVTAGPCFGGPPNRGWGPRNASYGLQIASEVMAAVNVTTLEELRRVPAEKAELVVFRFFVGQFQPKIW